MPKIELEHEQIAAIVQASLVEDYRMVMQDLTRLMGKGSALEPFELEDLENAMNLRVAMQTLLRYYMLTDEADALIESESLKFMGLDEEDTEWHSIDEDLEDDGSKSGWDDEDEHSDIYSYIDSVDLKTNALQWQLDQLEKKVDRRLGGVEPVSRPKVKFKLSEPEYDPTDPREHSEENWKIKITD